MLAARSTSPIDPRRGNSHAEEDAHFLQSRSPPGLSLSLREFPYYDDKVACRARVDVAGMGMRAEEFVDYT